MENYCKKIRMLLNVIMQANMNFQMTMSQNITKERAEAIVRNSVAGFVSSMGMLDKNQEDPSVRNFILEAILLSMQMYTDYYKKFNYLKKVSMIQESEEKIFDNSKRVTFENINSMIENFNVRNYLFDAIFEFDDLSVYDKVLQMKALTEEDIEYLSSMNPFFEAEYANYNVEVNRAFLIRQIGKWQKLFKDDIDKSYNDAADFLIKLGTINPDEYKGFIDEIVTEFGEDNVEEDYHCILNNALVNLYSNSQGVKLTK